MKVLINTNVNKIWGVEKCNNCSKEIVLFNIGDTNNPVWEKWDLSKENLYGKLYKILWELDIIPED